MRFFEIFLDFLSLFFFSLPFLIYFSFLFLFTLALVSVLFLHFQHFFCFVSLFLEFALIFEPSSTLYLKLSLLSTLGPIALALDCSTHVDYMPSCSFFLFQLLGTNIVCSAHLGHDCRCPCRKVHFMAQSP